MSNLSPSLLFYLSKRSQKKRLIMDQHGPSTLLFDSMFECGNLDKAVYMSPVHYVLYMTVDTNTKGH